MWLAEAAGGLKNIVGTIVGMVALTIDARDMEMGAGGYNFDDVANWLFHHQASRITGIGASGAHCSVHVLIA
jgi:hypothetical protein